MASRNADLSSYSGYTRLHADPLIVVIESRGDVAT